MKSGIDQPILITGAARSGTSMTAGIINICGAWGGKMSGPTRYNKRGMFENEEIRNDLMKPFLKSINCDPMGQDPLPDMEEVYKKAFSIDWKWRMRACSIIKKQGYKNEIPWFYKGAKMCLIWPLWYRAFPRATWIIVRRKDDDVIHSCLKTGFMRKYQDVEGWQTWVDVHKERFLEMEAAGLKIITIWPQKMVNGELDEIHSAVDSLGLGWKQNSVVDFISPALWSCGISHETLKEEDNGCSGD